MASQFDEAFSAVKSLAGDFEANKDYFLSPAYQESEVRKDFIDKFLIALGWDVNHDRQKNPFEQEVKVERGVNVHGGQRRADYAFYIAPNFRDVRFFAEAKKPFGDIATADNYFQTIRYGWNGQTPVAALTDFEQFHILDCRYKPDIDTALGQYIRKLHYLEYADKDTFAYIFYLFSRDAVANGSLENFVASLPVKRGKAVQRGLFKGGYQSFDDAFLEELDEHRDTLARAFKNKRPSLDGDTLTELTQRTIDRLVFMRFIEDKLIHPEPLVANFGDKATAWQDFIATSRRLDGIYNGIVFKKHDILDSATLKLDDDAFSDICEKLAHVNSPYDFNSIPIHILGSIYERFLGKVIVTTDKRARLEEKPEVRKAGGVYYTPEYVVRYIVENTVGKLIQEKTPSQIESMRFADIACGSGSFLLGVYDLLLRYHTKWFNTNPEKAKKAGCVLRDDGAWHLSLHQRRLILLNNIYGVDIDHQAVEVAQLSLYLKLLQEETTASARQHQLEFHETLLPPLNKNIVCGNSLIGTDILTGQLFVGDEERKLNPMDYGQRFPVIMRAGGFDAIVGNPPWISAWTGAAVEREYLTEKLALLRGHWDYYLAFLLKSLSLLSEHGLQGFVYPSSLLTEPYAADVRKHLIKDRMITELDVFGAERVFDKVSRKVCILFLQKQGHDKRATVQLWDAGKIVNRFQVDAKAWLDNHNSIITAKTGTTSDIKRKVDTVSVKVGNIYYVNYGAQICSKVKGAFSQDRLLGEAKRGNAKKCLTGSDVKRYYIAWANLYLDYQPDIMYGPRHPLFFEAPKLLVNKTSGKGYGLVATFDDTGFYCDQRVIGLVRYEHLGGSSLRLEFEGFDRVNSGESELFHLGLLNSALLSYYFSSFVATKNLQGQYTDVVPKMVRSLPLRRIDFGDRGEKSKHDKVVALVQQMLAARKQLATARSDGDKEFYGNKCESIDRQIDALVYELYGLTQEDIKVVQGGA